MPLWAADLWEDALWADALWVGESVSGATPLGPGDRTTLWAKYLDANGWGNDRYRAAIGSTGDLTTDTAAHLNQGNG